MQVEGKIKVIGEVQTFGENGFRKREVVITTQEQYPQNLMIEFVQERCDLLNTFQVGEDVKININLKGREWVSPEGVTKYFNSIQGWNISRLQAAQATSPEQQAPFPTATAPTTPPAENLNKEEGEENDLPF